MYYALLFKMDVTDDTQMNEKVFEVVLIATHATMVLVMISEAVSTGYSLKQEQVEGPWPRFRSSRTWTATRSIRGIYRVTNDSPDRKTTTKIA